MSKKRAYQEIHLKMALRKIAIDCRDLKQSNPDQLARVLHEVAERVSGHSTENIPLEELGYVIRQSLLVLLNGDEEELVRELNTLTRPFHAGLHGD